MKKFIAPIVLFVLAVALVVYLGGGFGGSRTSFNPEAYLTTRAKVDSLEMALWEAQNGTNGLNQAEIREELDAAWESLQRMRSDEVSEISQPVADADVEGEPVQESEAKSAKNDGFSSDTIVWIAGGAIAVILCFVILFLIFKRRKDTLTRQMETLKSESLPKESEDQEISFTPPQPRPRKTSIIADAEAYAARKRETQAQQVQPKAAPAPESSQAPKAEQKVAFEDENGVPENKIFTETPGGKPTLRPTARERITSAMKNLSDVLRAPRGLSRERTMKLRAQSRNSTGDPNLGGSNPLETSRFDREATEKVKILQLSRRGFPASAIASTLKISQEKVESIIKESLG
ncbi:MAG: hypothetical protein MJY87_02220 [Fibrobacter sp.]|nr:hypothetical protein [Fibrobacter sp.]